MRYRKEIIQMTDSESSKDKTKEVQCYKRAKTICSTYPISPASLWRKVKAGTFPRPIKLSTGITAWRNTDLLEWEKDPLNYRAKP
jgi:predicted DNA-binding transcriptional regulator AlpA